MTPNRVGDEGMDERLREVEGDVGTLKDWRVRTVDPHILRGNDFENEVKEFITEFKATSKVTSKLQDERHHSNSAKLNGIIAIAAVLSAVFAGLLVLVTYIVAHQRSFAIPLNITSSSPIETARWQMSILPKE